MYKNLGFLTVIVALLIIVADIIGSTIIDNKSWDILFSNYCEKKERQLDYFVKEEMKDLNMLLISHAVWTDTRENLLSRNSEWLYENATGYLQEDDSYGVDFQLITSENLDFVEYYGENIVENVSDSKTFINVLEKDISGKEILWIDDKLLILVASPVYDNESENPTGVYLIGRYFDNEVLDTLAETLGTDEVVSRLSIEKEPAFMTATSKNYSVISLSHKINIDEGEAYFNIVFNESTFKYIFTVQRYLSYIILFVIVSIGLIIELEAVKKISAYLDKFIKSIGKISEGDYKEKLVVRPHIFLPEMNKLSTAVNIMSSDIEKHLVTIEKNYLDMVEIIISAVEINDPFTYKHSVGVMKYATVIGKAIGFEDIETLRIASKLHDIGKISIPSNILYKEEMLTVEEFDLIKKHSLEGFKIIGNIAFFEKFGVGIKYHHERYDGTGYPYGLKGNEIPYIAQIISVADVFDALTSDRVYRKAMSHEKAMDIILDNSGKMFNPVIVDVFYNEMLRLSYKPYFDKNFDE